MFFFKENIKMLPVPKKANVSQNIDMSNIIRCIVHNCGQYFCNVRHMYFDLWDIRNQLPQCKLLEEQINEIKTFISS